MRNSATSDTVVWNGLIDLEPHQRVNVDVLFIGACPPRIDDELSWSWRKAWTWELSPDTGHTAITIVVRNGWRCVSLIVRRSCWRGSSTGCWMSIDNSVGYLGYVAQQGAITIALDTLFSWSLANTLPNKLKGGKMYGVNGVQEAENALNIHAWDQAARMQT